MTLPNVSRPLSLYELDTYSHCHRIALFDRLPEGVPSQYACMTKGDLMYLMLSDIGPTIGCQITVKQELYKPDMAGGAIGDYIISYM